MTEFLSQWSLSTAALMPHGYCFQWMPHLLSLHVISDITIAVAYFSIPLTLWYFVRHRADLPFKWVFLLFGAFIVACGTTHLMGIITVWYPAYWLSGWVKAGTAAVSIITAGALMPLIPKALALPSPAEMKAYNNTLEREVARRTRELEDSNQLLSAKLAELQETQQALTAARETAEEARILAEEANQAKSMFLANMSHELRTPLNGILGFAQILQQHPLPERQAHGVVVIQRSGEHLLNLINDILDLSRVEAGRLDIEAEDVDLEPLLHAVVEPLRMEAELKGLRMRFQTTQPLPPAVRVDSRRLRQVLVNLLSNAVKFTDSGEVSLRVVPEREGIHFEIRDTGVGISDADQNRIFQSFQQVGTVSAGGTGLGLAITRELVGLMGGKITVSSEPGEGSEFRVWLPIQASAAFPTTPQNAPTVIGYRGSAKSIMVVDDQLENQELAAAFLEPLGFQVVGVATVEAALEQMRQQPPDLILMDLVMPVVGGLEATRRIKADAALRHIPVVIVSASAFQYHRAESAAAGANDFLTKPLDLGALLETLRIQLGLRWIYYDELEAGNGPVDAHGDNGLSAFSDDQARRILDFASVGHSRGLRTYLEELGREPGLASGAAHLLELARQFRHETICELMEPLLGADQPGAVDEGGLP